MTSLLDLPAAAVLSLFRARRASPIDYWAEVENRIAQWEPHIHALVAYDPDGARGAAAAASERWAQGAPIGPLDGLPVTVKEMIATRGTPVRLGCATFDAVPAAEDAPAAARLREDGAIIFAKTTNPDFGMLSSGLSSAFPLTRNPWNPALNPGGSSAGAAAAGAAGYGPFHIGTDIGGSIRLPAGWTGLFGLKPSQGRVPVDPYYLGRCAGPMTRHVADAALLMGTLTRPDGRDATALPPERIAWTEPGAGLGRLRVGLMLETGCSIPVDPAIVAAVTAAAQAFADAGAEVRPVAPVLDRAMLDGVDLFFQARCWAELETMAPERRSRVLPYVVRWAEQARLRSPTEVIRGFNQTYAIRRACASLFGDLDLVLSPTSPVAGFPAEWASPTNDPYRPFEQIPFTLPWNMSEQPAASIACGWTQAGLPIGLQIVGPRFGDLRVLHVSAAYEALRGPMRWPAPPPE